MGDIICAKCGEPWDAYGLAVNDATTADEGRRIKAGEGCPCCGFGSGGTCVVGFPTQVPAVADTMSTTSVGVGFAVNPALRCSYRARPAWMPVITPRR